MWIGSLSIVNAGANLNKMKYSWGRHASRQTPNPSPVSRAGAGPWSRGDTRQPQLLPKGPWQSLGTGQEDDCTCQRPRKPARCPPERKLPAVRRPKSLLGHMIFRKRIKAFAGEILGPFPNRRSLGAPISKSLCFPCEVGGHGPLPLGEEAGARSLLTSGTQGRGARLQPRHARSWGLWGSSLESITSRIISESLTSVSGHTDAPTAFPHQPSFVTISWSSQWQFGA